MAETEPLVPRQGVKSEQTTSAAPSSHNRFVGFLRRAALRPSEILPATPCVTFNAGFVQGGGDHRISPKIARRTNITKRMARNKIVATLRMSVLIEAGILLDNTGWTAGES